MTTPATTNELQITEIFHSIQGESSYAGLPCAFIRLAGCTVGCRWCDSLYAVRDQGNRVSFAEIIRTVREMRVPLVEITGGEPLEQAKMPAFASLLVDEGFTVLVETSGTCDLTPLAEPIVRIMDIKCPGSGVETRMDWGNIDRLRLTDEVKFVLADRADYEYARENIRKYALERKVKEVLLSPLTGGISLADLAKWILEDHLPVRLQAQLHRIIWPEISRGV